MCQCASQVVDAERFCQQWKPTLGAQALGVRKAADQYDWQRWREPMDPMRGLDPIQPRHGEIDNHNFRSDSLAFDDLDCCRPTSGLVNSAA